MLSRALACGIFALYLASGPNWAATQGAKGNPSTGTLTITFVRGSQVRIGGLDDFDFGVWPNAGLLTANDNICIGLTDTANYGLTASGDGTTGNPDAFTLSNGSAQIAYRVFYADSTNAGQGVEMTAGALLSGQKASAVFRRIYNVNNPCAPNSENGNLRIQIDEAELLAAAAGVFTGVLTLTLSPE